MILLIPNVTIPSDYEYISGTVNNIDTVFVADMVITGLCLCSCELSSSYAVSLSFFDADDELISTVTKTITQDEVGFIFDRTQADIDYLKGLTPAQRARLVSNHKGALNVSDLQRILNVFTLLNILNDTSMDIETIPEFPSDVFFQSFLDNLASIKGTGYQLTDSPVIPILPLNDFDKWNKLERILWENWDIRTSKFKYFEVPMREGDSFYPVVYVYNGDVYQSTLSQLITTGLPVFNGMSITTVMEAIQHMLNV